MLYEGSYFAYLLQKYWNSFLANNKVSDAV